MRAALLLGLLALPACGSDATLIIVGVSGRPGEATVLRATVTLNGKQTAAPEEIREGLDEFGLLLPPQASGPFLLEAEGVDGPGCVAARGRTDTVLTGKDRVRLSLAMERLAPPDCSKAGAR